MDPAQEDSEAEQGLPAADADAVRRVAELTGMTQEAARAFVAYHAGLGAPRERR